MGVLSLSPSPSLTPSLSLSLPHTLSLPPSFSLTIERVSAGVLYACNLQGCAEERTSVREEREIKREGGREKAREKEKDRQRKMMAGSKGMTDAYAPFSYLVLL